MTQWETEGAKKDTTFNFQATSSVYEAPLPKACKTSFIDILRQFETDFGCELTVRGRKKTRGRKPSWKHKRELRWIRFTTSPWGGWRTGSSPGKNGCVLCVKPKNFWTFFCGTCSGLPMTKPTCFLQKMPLRGKRLAMIPRNDQLGYRVRKGVLLFWNNGYNGQWLMINIHNDPHRQYVIVINDK